MRRGRNGNPCGPRALASMTETGLLYSFTHAGETVYRLCGSASHHHLVCRVCGMAAERQGKGDRVRHLGAAVAEVAELRP
ncbi:transcriptional repressor [Nonomuraea sp. NPDC004580]|uniref:transcriptional repressor n=1 Tax=Nonomuraea sp. NPDC004580 TaxID=3154552 RepID=UPI0033A79BFE